MANLSCSAVVVGGGVVGLATFRALSATLPDVVLLEKTPSLGQSTSSRNSGVVHSGIYHNDKLLKGRLCRLGRDLLYRYCEERDVPHKRCGKVVIAQSRDEMGYIDKLFNTTQKLGVPSPKFLDSPEAIKALEPNISALCGVHFPSTGVVDVSDLMTKMQADGLESGGEVLLNSRIIAIRRASRALSLLSTDPGWTLSISQGDESYEVTTPLGEKYAMLCTNYSQFTVNTSLRSSLYSGECHRSFSTTSLLLLGPRVSHPPRSSSSLLCSWQLLQAFISHFSPSHR